MLIDLTANLEKAKSIGSNLVRTNSIGANLIRTTSNLGKPNSNAAKPLVRSNSVLSNLGKQKPQPKPIANDQEDDIQVDWKELIKYQLSMKPLRKKLWWKIRVHADNWGFPQEVSLEEYEILRAKNEKKFREDYPSIIWQEERREQIEKDRIEKTRKRDRKLAHEKLKAKQRKEKQLVYAEKHKKYLDQYQKEFDDNDRAMILKMERDKMKVARLEEFEQEKEIRLQRNLLAENERARRHAEQLAHEQHEMERLEAERREEERKEEEADLQRTVSLIMARSGTITGSQREKPLKRPENMLVVRFETTYDDQDGVLLAFNLGPIVEYIKRFPTVKDHMKKFPQFFAPSTTVVKALPLNERGGEALGKVLAVQAFPRMTKLSIGWNNIAFRGCKSIMKGLSSGACQHLTHLILTGNNLGDESAEVIAEALKQDGEKKVPKLVQIDLDSNQIADKGAKALAHMLLGKTSPNIQNLNLNSNQIKDQGARSLTRAVEAKPSFVRLALRSNQISTKTSRVLAMHAPFLVI